MKRAGPAKAGGLVAALVALPAAAPAPAGSDPRRRFTQGMPLAAVLLSALIAVVLAGCGSPARPSVAAEQKALLADGGGAEVRLGLVSQPPDAAGLAGVYMGSFQRDLGAGVRLQVVPFTSAAAAGQALADGRLDAAYLDPVTAVRLWQDSRGKLVQVVAGVASSRAAGVSRDEDACAVLVFTRALLLDRPAVARGLLEGDVQAVTALQVDPVSARAAVGQELADLGTRIPGTALARALAQVSFTNDPMAGTVLAQARQAAAAGQLKPVTSLAGLYDLAPLNVLLKAAGQRQVST